MHNKEGVLIILQKETDKQSGWQLLGGIQHAKGYWRVRLHCSSVQIINTYIFFPYISSVVWCPLLLFLLLLIFFWPPFFPEQTGMPMPTTGMPACVHSSLAGTSEKSLLPVKVDCWAFGLLNSLKIFTGVFNRMQSLLEWKKCWCLCVLGMWAWCVILHYLDIVGADWTAGSGRCAVKTPHCLPEAIKPCTNDQ